MVNTETGSTNLIFFLGPIVRIQPDILVFNDPKMLPVIYHRTADKDPQFYEVASLGLGLCLFSAIKHETHARFRRRVNPCVSISIS